MVAVGWGTAAVQELYTFCTVTGTVQKMYIYWGGGLLPFPISLGSIDRVPPVYCEYWTLVTLWGINK